MTTDSKFKPNFRQTYENVPGMKDALETLKPEHWNKNAPSAAEFDPLADLIRKIDYCLDTAKRVVVTSTNNPAVLVTALPFIAEMRLQHAMDELSSIPEGKALVDTARLNHTPITLEGNPLYQGGSASHGSGVNVKGDTFHNQYGVRVQGFATRGTIIGILTHELQHNMQGHSSTVINPLNDSIPTPVEQVWYNRIIEADAQATAVDIAWKLKEAGKPKAWECIGGNSPAWQQIRDAYEKTATADPSSVVDGRAKRAAFDEWFVAGHPQHLLERIYNRQGVNNALSENDQQNGTRGDKPFKPMDMDRVVKIGDLGPVNYLKIPGSKPLDDPYYRTPNWDAMQAGRLSKLHESYDDNGAKQQSKFALPKTANFPKPGQPETKSEPAVVKPAVMAAAVKPRVAAMKM